MSLISRPILDIILAAQCQGPATERELRLALVAVASLMRAAEKSERELAEAVLAGKPSAKLRASLAVGALEARFRARKLPAEDYLGPEHTPGTPENLRLRKAAATLFKRATEKTA